MRTSSMRTSSLLVALGACLLASTAVLAERQPKRIPIPKTDKELRTLQERIRKGEFLPKEMLEKRNKIPDRPPPPVPNPEALTQVQDAKGHVVEASASEILLARQVEPKKAEALVHAGFRKIKSLKEAAHRTILGDRLFAVYEVDAETSRTLTLENLVGREVLLKLRRDATGEPRIVGVEVLAKAEGTR